jgi:hypothetical protein
MAKLLERALVVNVTQLPCILYLVMTTWLDHSLQISTDLKNQQ